MQKFIINTYSMELVITTKINHYGRFCSVFFFLSSFFPLFKIFLKPLKIKCRMKQIFENIHL